MQDRAKSGYLAAWLGGATGAVSGVLVGGLVGVVAYLVIAAGSQQSDHGLTGLLLPILGLAGASILAAIGFPLGVYVALRLCKHERAGLTTLLAVLVAFVGITVGIMTSQSVGNTSTPGIALYLAPLSPLIARWVVLRLPKS